MKCFNLGLGLSLRNKKHHTLFAAYSAHEPLAGTTILFPNESRKARNHLPRKTRKSTDKRRKMSEIIFLKISIPS